MAPMFDAQNLQFVNSEINNVGGDQHITKIFMTEDKSTLDLLKPAVRNEYHVPRCMDGTRESVFREIDLWLNDPDVDSTPNIMWINGSPGVGKSAIASSLVSILTERRRLGSFFFFKRGDANLSDPACLWRTVAYDLAQFNPFVKSNVVEFLNRPGFRDSDILLHFRCLIKDVLTKNNGQLCSHAPVVVIDALDECGSDDSHSSQRQILLDTLTFWTRLPPSFKLIITGRDERMPIFFQNPLLCHKITLETGDSVKEETQTDIRVFFERSFDNIRPTFGLPPTWPGKPAIDKLTNRAAGLFIWAKTAMVFMGERRGKPNNKLQLVLSGNLGTKTESIDMLYRNILYFSFEDSDDATLQLFRMVLGAIVVSKVPLHRDDLKRFLGVLGRRGDEDDWEINSILHKLSSVMDIDGPLRFKHLSFIEFLTDPNRCREHQFFIDQGEHHQQMALACLRVLNIELRFNISGLASSYESNEDMINPSKRIPDHVSYACQYWADHFTLSPLLEYLLDEIENFLHHKFLFWLEVLSVLGKGSSASTILRKVASRNDVSYLPPSIAQFMREANEFVIAFRDPISFSAPHIYLSALPFSRRGGMVRNTFEKHLPFVLSAETSTERRKQHPILVLDGHSGTVNCIAFSLDGRRIVSGSDDRTIRVWDAETGEAVLQPFEGHTDSVASITFSPNGKRIVSGSDDWTIRNWDAETGEAVLQPFKGHTHRVTSVAFSPDGKHIISGSYDSTIRVWNAETGEAELKPFVGHTDMVVSAAFSLDGKRIVSSSYDRTIGVWDVETNEAVFKPLGGHEVSFITFSPNGRRIVSSSRDNTIRIWDSETGEAVLKPLEGHTDLVTSIAFSPDSKRIVSGSYDCTIHVWDAETGEVVCQPLEGHDDIVTSVTFSPDGKRVISASRDCTICVWDTETGEAKSRPMERHAKELTSIVFSPDGKLIASGSYDCAICVWNAETGEAMLKPLEGHTDSVISVAFSPDGQRLVSASSDRTIRIWDARTGEVVLRPLVGHSNTVTSAAFSPDGRRVVSGSYDWTIRVWDVEAGVIVLKPLEGHTDSVTSVAFSPNGKRIISGSGDFTIRIWDAETGDVVLRPLEGHTDRVTSVAFSPDGLYIVSGSYDYTVRVWDAETGAAVLWPLERHTGEVFSVGFSPDGGRIVSGSYDRTICIWDAETGEAVLNSLHGHTDSVSSVAFSPDGRSLASASFDCTIRLWDIESTCPIQCDINSDCSMMVDDQYTPITFSPNLKHAFPIHGLFEGDSEGDPRSAFTAWYGWILGPRDELLFWVPPEYRPGLWWPRTKAIFGAPITHIDPSRMVHGRSWSKCYLP